MTTDFQETLAQDQEYLRIFIEAGVSQLEARSGARVDMGADISMEDFILNAAPKYMNDEDLLTRVPAPTKEQAANAEATQDWNDLIDYIESWYQNIGKPFRLHIIEPYKLEYL